MWRRVSVLGVFPLILALTGCYYSPSIAHINNNPYRYQGRVVHINGTVVNSAGAIVAGYYQVDDGTGKIVVLSHGNVPRRGTRVKLSGRVSSGISVLGQNFGTTIQERDRRIEGGYGPFGR